MVGRHLRVTGTALVIAVALVTPVLAMATATSVGATTASPTTSVLLPANGATVSEGTWLDAAASSPVGIASVTFEVSGGSISDQVVGSGTPTIYGYIGGWNTRDVPNGTYSLQSVATDKSADSSTSAPVTVTVDNPPLSTAVLLPASGATLDPVQGFTLDAAASVGASGVTIEVIAGGAYAGAPPLTFTTTPTLFGWVNVQSANQTLCSNGCASFPVPVSIQSVASYPGGATVTSPAVDATYIGYLPPGSI